MAPEGGYPDVAVIMWSDGTQEGLEGWKTVAFVDDALDDIHAILVWWSVNGFAFE